MKKQVIAMTIAAVMTASAAVAQTGYFSSLETHKATNLDMAAARYISCLESCNEGVVASALAHVTRMKLYAPEKEFTVLHAKINSLATTGCSPTIRYKAYLAGLVFDSPSIFAQEQGQKFVNAEEMFSAISARLQVSLLGENSRKYVRPE